MINTYNKKYFMSFAKKIVSKIDPEVINEINKHTNFNTINILISASPNFYVKHIVAQLGWQGKGSYFDENNNFICLYGANKIKWLRDNYESKDYLYYFAISDDKIDMKLLHLFKKFQLWTLI